MIGELVRTLREGGHTLVVANGAQIRTFDRRGVADLHTLLTDGGEFLRGATVADKVVGKAAAALMLLGGVSEMHTEVISRPALDLLAGSGMRVGYEVEVPHVINRDRTGWCPLATAGPPGNASSGSRSSCSSNRSEQRTNQSKYPCKHTLQNPSRSGSTR